MTEYSMPLSAILEHYEFPADINDWTWNDITRFTEAIGNFPRNPYSGFAYAAGAHKRNGPKVEKFARLVWEKKCRMELDPSERRLNERYR